MTQEAIQDKEDTSDAISVLLVEDNEVDAMVIRQHVEKAFDGSSVDLIGDLASVYPRLENNRYDYLILDLFLPDSEGLDTLREVMKVASELPILVYTGVENSDWALEALKIGAQDYLIKGRGDAHTIRRIIQHTMERKRTEQRLYQNEQMLRTFIRHSPAGIAVFDDAFRIIMCSDRWKAEHGVANRQVIGERLDDLFVHSSNKWNYLYTRAMNGELVRGDEDQFITNDGAEEYIRWEMMPWYDSEDHAGGVIQFTEFVTSEREMRKALEEAKQSLEQKVQERTRDLEASLLAAESAQNAKQEFFANITHELRTPLHAIINFSKFGMKKFEKAERTKLREYFEDINKSGNRLLGLVNDVLDLTKHQFGKTTFDMDSYNIEEMVNDALKEVSAIAESNHVGLKTEILCEEKELVFDKLRVHQVMINLLSNAIKFTNKDTDVTIRVEKMEEDDGMLQGAHDEQIAFKVIDQGEGIPEEDIDEIFDEFAQSKKVKSGTFSAGTGLGLSICRHIVSEHGGTIWAVNNEDSGATVTFTIPLNLKQNEAEDESEDSGD